ncbi:MAG: ATP-binding protein [Alphaproteobacteria bacterium]|nr:ATP-binding protein [Alphaproteobacteria bacterium]
MFRYAYRRLIDWKNNISHKPLLLTGARQTGKTWLLKEFGQNEYENTAYINFDFSPLPDEVFSGFNIQKIIRAVSSLTGQPVFPSRTLIIFDEVQENPLALTSLKYFAESELGYNVCASGSLLGIGLHAGTGFPVGKVEEINLYPMSFNEFVLAKGEKAKFDFLQSSNWDEISLLNASFSSLLQEYCFTGGMPEVIKTYLEGRDLYRTREVQRSILLGYEKNFSKHIPANLLSKVELIWSSLPSQLAKENKKFIFSSIKKGSRIKEFEEAIKWLEEAGLVYKVDRCSKVGYPLKFYEEQNIFKLFPMDLGLLGCMTDVDLASIFVKDSFFEEFNGAFAEQFIAQTIISSDFNPFYYAKSNSRLKLDFVIQYKDLAIPIEVKSGNNTKAKSLKTILVENPDLKAIRFSQMGFKRRDNIVNVPLFMADSWLRALKTSNTQPEI